MATSRLVEDLAAVLVLHNEELKRPRVLNEAMVDQPPELALTMDSGCTLTVTVQDVERRLLADPITKRRLFAKVPGPGKDPLRFEYVRLRKAGNRLTLEFEDSVVGALRRETSPLAIRAGSVTRAEAIVKIARDVDVKYSVDTSADKKLSRAVERSQAGDETTAWDVIGELAEERQWRRFSDGQRLVVGPDEWLIDRDKKPTVLREYHGPTHDIDFDLDIGKRASAATVSVDAERWALPLGSVVRVHDEMGPAAGLWLVSEFRRPLTSVRASVGLVRKRHELEEPKPVGPGDPGNPNNAPRDPGDPGGSAGGAREAMVRFALAQSGKPYVYGASGPSAYDCSGLVQAATGYAGNALPKPAANQWARVVAAKKTLTVGAALGMRGALLFRIGVSTYNHVAISLGNGSTVEAMGTPYGCGVFGGAASRGWTGGGWWL